MSGAVVGLMAAQKIAAGGVVFDNTCADTFAFDVLTLTSTGWTAGGSDRGIFGAILTNDNTPTTHTGMKLGGSGGTALTQVSTTQAANTLRLSAWRLIGASPSGSQTSYGNWAASQLSNAIGMVSYTGVNQTTPVGTIATNTGTFDTATGTATVDIATVNGDMVLAVAACRDAAASNPALTPAGGSTGRYEVEGASLTNAAIQWIEKVATGTTTTMSVGIAVTANSVDWAIIAFVVNDV